MLFEICYKHKNESTKKMEMEMQYDVSITLTPLLIYFRHLKKKETKNILVFLPSKSPNPINKQA
jgi:hypothetical protein